MDDLDDSEMTRQQRPKPPAEAGGEDWLAEVEAERAERSGEERGHVDGGDPGPGATAGGLRHAAPPAHSAAPPARGPRRRRWPAGYVLLAILIGFALGGELNAKSLHRTAEELPFGAKRSIAMALVRPITAISSALQLDRPAELADSVLGLDRPEKLDTRQALGVAGEVGAAAAR